MNLLFRVVFSSACTSTHHKLAMDALCHLQGQEAAKWQKLFLKNYQGYLQGSKAPDKQFKDFRNHVLHVRDNNWGGAPKTARVWYDKTVQALGRQQWSQAVYAAGVLSHYYTDPIQPFHTGQSQAESNIHRAAEWSIAKAYDEIKQLKSEPTLPVPSHDADWLEQMVIQGAEFANPYYETLIQHYDMKQGTKNPPRGLDQTSREILARLIRYAAIGFARILERAFEQSGATPPNTQVSLAGFLATLKIPIFWVTRKMADAQERKIVTAMYQELLQTGKVDQTLPEDDRQIQQLHQKEVLGVPAVNRPSERPKVAPRDAAEHRSAPVVPLRPGHEPSSEEDDRSDLPFYLDRSSDVEDAPSIGPKTAKRLAKIDVQTVDDLLALDPSAAADQLNARHITSKVIRQWQDQARLMCRVPGLRGHDAQILVACGWSQPEHIAQSEAKEILDVVEPFITTSEGKRIIRSGKKPDLNEVRDWIQWADHARSLRAA